jgi:hypothetical protein
MSTVLSIDNATVNVIRTKNTRQQRSYRSSSGVPDDIANKTDLQLIFRQSKQLCCIRRLS